MQHTVQSRRRSAPGRSLHNPLQVEALDSRLSPGDLLLGMLFGSSWLGPAVSATNLVGWESAHDTSTASRTATGQVAGLVAVQETEMPGQRRTAVPYSSPLAAREAARPDQDGQSLPIALTDVLNSSPTFELQLEQLARPGATWRPPTGTQGCDLYPNIWSWLLNQDDRTGSSPDPRIHQSVSQILADVQRVAYNDSDVYIVSASIPSHPVGPFPMNPNIPSDQGFVLRFPHTAQQGAGTFETNLGPIGTLVNGVAIFNARDARSYQNQNIWHQDANFFEAASFDSGHGHPAPNGTYHYHANPVSLREQVGDDGSSHSPLLGYAYDGFPIYGPYGYANPDGTGGVMRMESSYRLRDITQRTTLPDGTQLPPQQWGPAIGGQYPLGAYVEDYEYAPGLGTLDEFNGRFTVTPEYPCGTFAYFDTLDAQGAPAYPYLVGPRYYGEVLWDNIQHGVEIPDDVIDYWP